LRGLRVLSLFAITIRPQPLEELLKRIEEERERFRPAAHRGFHSYDRRNNGFGDGGKFGVEVDLDAAALFAGKKRWRAVFATATGKPTSCG
jgi:hypothetical protein